MGAVAGAIIGGIGSLIGGSEQASASKQASQLQYQANMAALQQQQQMFGVAQNALSPYYSAGASELPTLKALLTQGSAAGTLSSLPGFQFQSQWGTQAAKNALTAQGLGGSSGPMAKAISDYNNGLAGTYYNNYVQQAQNFVNSGAGAGSALAGNATAAAQGMAQSLQAGGNAQASGVLGSANALSGGIQGAAGGIGNALLLNSLLSNNGAGSSLYSPVTGGNGPYSVPTA